ncbi:hypothetical protein AUR64_03720 [Haloprofundus marisrubri]|uniref:Uncharacterized protein n=1 Tax=Haloprofundus marisrubri TaxID=1514971 RepID=A0A0W1RD19_9EURY|nr:hypothetical protein [Haloprofundus marisrubri]KTG11374.1 hypothetical protein AUR64_03720 [Haloprofundus marisrubri]
METVPENIHETEEFILTDILHGIELDPQESLSLLSYMQERHEHLFGPFTTYFVLGSYERPFKYRLELALSELNSRLHAYAYLLAPQPDPDLPERLPALKIKFYLHAIYADAIPLILEHNTGGALAEFGRADHPVLLERTYVFPRGYKSHYDGSVDSLDAVHARGIELAYQADGENALCDALEQLIEEAEDNGISVTTADLTAYIEQELGGRLVPSYSGVLTDGIKHYEQLGQCFSWATEEDLRTSLTNVP